MLHNNHMKWGWDDGWFNKPVDENSIFKFQMTGSHQPMSFRDEAIRAAKLIAEKSTKPMMLSLSGGIDSQVIGRALSEAKIPFEACTIIWKGNDGNVINDMDVHFATEYAKLHNIKQQYLELNIYDQINNFFLSQQVESGFKSLLLSPAAHFKNTHAVLGGGVMFEYIRPSNTTYSYVHSHVNHQFHIDQQIEGTSEFFVYTVELMRARYEDPVGKSFLSCNEGLFAAWQQHCIKKEDEWRTYEAFVKPLVYANNFDGLIHRAKSNGYEKVTDYTYWKKKFQDSLPVKNRYCFIPLAELYEAASTPDKITTWTTGPNAPWPA